MTYARHRFIPGYADGDTGGAGAASTGATGGTGVANVAAATGGATGDAGASTVPGGGQSVLNTTSTAVVAPKWPENWHDLAAGSDAAKIEEAKRYASPTDLLDSLIETKKIVSKGFQPATLKANATEADVKEYRTKMGIPATPAEYKIELGQGRSFGEDDQPIVGKMLERFHAEHMTPAEVNRELNHYHMVLEMQAKERHTAHQAAVINAIAELKAEYGLGWDGNKAAIESYLGTLDKEVSAVFRDAIGPTGYPIFSNVKVIKYFLQRAVDHNPLSTVVSGGGGSPNAAVQDEIDGLKKQMGDPKSDYNVGPNKEKLQARYRDLIDMRDRGKVAA